MKVIPLGDRVLVRQDEAKERVGAIFVPEQAKDAPQVGTVLAVGEGRGFDQAGEELVEEAIDAGWAAAKRTTRKRNPPSVQVGDRVLYGKFSGAKVEVDGVEVFLLREDEIIAKVIEEPAPEA